MLTWLAMGAEPIIGDGRYATQHDCEAFVEFIGYDGIIGYTNETGYVISDGDGKTFTAKCVHVEVK